MTRKEKAIKQYMREHDKRLYEERMSIMRDCGRHV